MQQKLKVILTCQTDLLDLLYTMQSGCL